MCGCRRVANFLHPHELCTDGLAPIPKCVGACPDFNDQRWICGYLRRDLSVSRSHSVARTRQWQAWRRRHNDDVIPWAKRLLRATHPKTGSYYRTESRTFGGWPVIVRPQLRFSRCLKRFTRFSVLALHKCYGQRAGGHRGDSQPSIGASRGARTR